MIFPAKRVDAECRPCSCQVDCLFYSLTASAAGFERVAVVVVPNGTRLMFIDWSCRAALSRKCRKCARSPISTSGTLKFISRQCKLRLGKPVDGALPAAMPVSPLQLRCLQAG